MDFLEYLDERIDRLHERLEAEAIEPSEYDIIMAVLQEVQEIKHDYLKSGNQLSIEDLDDGF
jgi:hypothetical protein